MKVDTLFSLAVLASSVIAAPSPAKKPKTTKKATTTKKPTTTKSTSPAPSSTPTTPNVFATLRKAGLSGYVGISQTAGFATLAPYIGWYTDYSPNPPYYGNVQGFGMLWGTNASPCQGAAQDLQTYLQVVNAGTPTVMFGFYEPDCYCPDSSQMSVQAAQAGWNQYIGPLGARGTTLGSPSMCKQLDEDFLTPFQSGISRGWDVTSVHINVPNLDLVKADIQYFRKYGKPIVVSEFACVDARNGWNPCTNQTQINQFVYDAVAYFQSQPDIVAYGPSNGNGLGSVWPLFTQAGQLTATGYTYLNAIQNIS